MGAYDAVIEIPRGSRVKYEVDHGTGRVFLDRILYTAFGYPTNYGFFENTLGEDGDPLDVLVLLDFDLAPGVLAKRAPRRRAQDERRGRRRRQGRGGARRRTRAGRTSRTSNDIPEFTRKEIEHFFEHYKDLEPNKWVKVDEWASAAEAERLVGEAFDRFKEHEGQTAHAGRGRRPRRRPEPGPNVCTAPARAAVRPRCLAPPMKWIGLTGLPLT